jgi:hypothetical protein
MVSYSSDNELVPCFGAKRRAGLGNRSARPGSKEHRGNVSRRHWFGSAAWGQRSSPMPAGPKLPARHSARRHAADPDNRGERVFGRADRACDKVGRFTNPAAAIDIGAAMPVASARRNAGPAMNGAPIGLRPASPAGRRRSGTAAVPPFPLRSGSPGPAARAIGGAALLAAGVLFERSHDHAVQICQWPCGTARCAQCWHGGHR